MVPKLEAEDGNNYIIYNLKKQFFFFSIPDHSITYFNKSRYVSSNITMIMIKAEDASCLVPVSRTPQRINSGLHGNFSSVVVASQEILIAINKCGFWSREGMFF